jgi:phosphatidylserine decarboxylase
VDGRVLHLGIVSDLGRVEQVKGITYSLDALIGSPSSSSSSSSSPSGEATPLVSSSMNNDHSIVMDSQFANVNGIEYSLGQLIGGESSYEESYATDEAFDASTAHQRSRREGPQTDASVPPTVLGDSLSHDTEVAVSMGLSSSLPKGLASTGDEGTSGAYVRGLRPGNSLFFAVIYLSPGDYHRFHSPSTWVVERRRHFIGRSPPLADFTLLTLPTIFPGDLFSVSPYMAKRLQNLFVLNERVALLGRWSYGFFAMVPVGAYLDAA